MVRATKPSPEGGIDLGYQLFSENRFRNHFYFVNKQALPILIKSLTLGEPEEPLSFDNQTRVPAAIGVNSYRILRMRHPRSMKRGVGREQIQPRTVISRS